MTDTDAVDALGALAQMQRLRAFRALVVAGPAGLIPSLLAQSLEVSPSALSFHLKELLRAGLIDCEQRGRNLVYRARFDRVNALVGYLTEHCCQGAACAVAPAAVDCTDC